MIKFKTILKKSIVLFTLVALLTCVFFVSSKPKVVKADVLAVTGVALGGAVLLSYFASMGIDLVFNNTDGTTLEEYANSIISDYEASTGTVNTYFDSEGTFIGTEEDLNIILSDQSQAYWNMGKDLTNWLEDVKSWFVSENNLSVGTVTSLYSQSGLICYDGQLLPAISNLNGDLRSYSLIDCNQVSDACFYQVTENYGFGLSVQSVDSYNNFTLVINDNGAITTKSFPLGAGGFNYPEVCIPVSSPTFNQGFPSNCLVTLSLYANGTYRSLYNKLIFDIPLNSLASSEMSLDGALTDGYEDFENALNQGLTDQAENENATVAVGVGSVGDALTAEQVKEAILEALAENSYSGSLTGVYENQAAAEEELEGEQEFSPTYPSDWVIVNGLEDFFPFCIPWDLYSVIATLNVPPETPKFTYVVSTGGVFEDQEIEVDLSDFDTVAQIFRIMMAIGFLVFLIIKTRDLIRG